MNKESGMASLLLLLLSVVVLAGLYVYVYKPETAVNLGLPEINVNLSNISKGGSSFSKIEEPENTPEEINDKALNELDTLMNDVEKNTSSEDFSDFQL